MLQLFSTNDMPAPKHMIRRAFLCQIEPPTGDFGRIRTAVGGTSLPGMRSAASSAIQEHEGAKSVPNLRVGGFGKRAQKARWKGEFNAKAAAAASEWRRIRTARA